MNELKCSKDGCNQPAVEYEGDAVLCEFHLNISPSADGKKHETCSVEGCKVDSYVGMDGRPLCYFHFEEACGDKKRSRQNKGKPRMTKAMLMPKAMEALVKVIEFGEGKYGPATDRGWLSYNADEVLDSLSRHMVSLVNGEINDEETGLPHAASVLFNAAVYLELTTEDGYFDRS